MGKETNYNAQIDGQTLGQEILHARLRQNISRQSLAKLARVSFYVIRSLEQGTVNNPNPDNVKAIKKALEM